MGFRAGKRRRTLSRNAAVPAGLTTQPATELLEQKKTIQQDKAAPGAGSDTAPPPRRAVLEDAAPARDTGSDLPHNPPDPAPRLTPAPLQPALLSVGVRGWKGLLVVPLSGGDLGV